MWGGDGQIVITASAEVPQEGVENYIDKGRRTFGIGYINIERGGEDLMRCLRRIKYLVIRSANCLDEITTFRTDQLSIIWRPRSLAWK
jgi:hypothetical protein